MVHLALVPGFGLCADGASESLRPLAGQIGGLEQQLNELEALVVDLDEYSKRLENRVKKYVFS